MKKIIKGLLPLITVSLVLACAPTVTVNPPSGSPTSSAKPSAKPSVKPSAKPAALPAPTASKVADFVWTKYNLKFKLPSDMKTIKNEDGEFRSENPAILFELFPWKDIEATVDSVIKAGLAGINEDPNSFKLAEDFSGLVTVNGLEGVVVAGTATEGGKPINVAFIGLIDNDSENNYIAYVTFNQAKASEEDKNISLTGDIFSSFAKVK